MEDVPVRDFTARTCVVGSVGMPEANEYTNKFGEPVPMELSLFGVALAIRKLATAAGDAVGLAASASAATPAIWGVAIEVPLMVLVAVVLLFQADVMLLPGPKISRHVP